MIWKNRYILFIVLSICTVSCTFAQTSSDLQSRIDERNNQIKQLQQEIDQYNTEVTNIGNQATTLQNNIKALDITQKKITTNITLTESKITKTNLTIEQLGDEIDKTISQIDTNRKSIISSLKNLQEIEDKSIIELVLSKNNIGDVWSDIENMRQIELSVHDKSKELVLLQADLEIKQNSSKTQKKSLLGLKQDLNDQKQTVVINKKEKSTILTQTKNKETEYKKIIASKQAQVEAYEKELFDYESQLNLITNPNQIPGAHHGMLSWPVDNVHINQLFGVTGDSARLYVSGSHNGVDFKASIGTPVKAVLDGTVVGLGDTDIYSGCYSFGRWIMLKHNNGLSTIYAHLSVIKVNIGQSVAAGDVIGLSGYSGYVYPPGPAGQHLHLGVYATAGVRIEQFVNSHGCKQAIVPLADTKAYLDPMIYLPTL